MWGLFCCGSNDKELTIGEKEIFEKQTGQGKLKTIKNIAKRPSAMQQFINLSLENDAYRNALIT